MRKLYYALCLVGLINCTPFKQVLNSLHLAKPKPHPLLQLALHLKSENTLPKNWNIKLLMDQPNTDQPCKWPRITCNNKKEIISIDLREYCFQTLPATAFQGLDQVQTLSIGEAGRSVIASPQIGRCQTRPRLVLDLTYLTGLVHLDLSGNSQIVQLSNLPPKFSRLIARISDLQGTLDISPVSLKDLNLDFSSVTGFSLGPNTLPNLEYLSAVQTPLTGVLDLQHIFLKLRRIKLLNKETLIRGNSTALDYLSTAGKHLPNGLDFNAWPNLTEVYITQAGTLSMTGIGSKVTTFSIQDWLVPTLNLDQIPGAQEVIIDGDAITMIKGKSSQLTNFSAADTKLTTVDFASIPQVSLVDLQGAPVKKLMGKADHLTHLNVLKTQLPNLRSSMMPMIIDLSISLPSVKLLKGKWPTLRELRMANAQGEINLSPAQFPGLTLFEALGKRMPTKINCGRRAQPIAIYLDNKQASVQLTGQCYRR